VAWWSNKATFVAEVPSGEHVLAMICFGGEVYVYTGRAAYRVDMNRGLLVDQAMEAEERDGRRRRPPLKKRTP
jgi:hypothetical protein